MRGSKDILDKLNAIHNDVLELRKAVEQLREVQETTDITDGLSSIISYDRRVKRDE